MRFSLFTTAALASSAAAAVVPVDPSKATTATWEGTKDLITTSDAVEKRSIVVSILTAAGTALASQAAKLAVEEATSLIQNLGNWDEAREAFTKATTANMWKNNPDYNKYPAAICYNMGYAVADWSKISEVVSVKLRLGRLNTDYDCMYMERGNAFYTWEDGGYINLSYSYNSYCSYDSSNGDLTCR